MKQASSYLRKRWKNLDDSLVNPPKDHSGQSRNFKGQSAHQKNLGQNPMPNPQQVLFRHRIMEDQILKLQPRNLRVKNWFYFGLFSVWYVGVTLFIMYRMKGDDLDQLQKQANERERRKKLFPAQGN